MSAIINQELKARGVAPVIVIVNQNVVDRAANTKAAAMASGTADARTSATDVKRLAKHFSSAETAIESQIAAAAATGRPVRPSVRAGMTSRTAKKPIAQPPAARYYPNLGVMYGTVTREGLAALRNEKSVQAVVSAPQLSLIRPDARALASLTARLTWGLRKLKVDALWKKGLEGQGVLVGHLDTGVDGKHPALKGAIRHFAEFDDFGQEVQPAPKPFDTEDHGTHTAATICGRAVRGRCVGVAPKARLASAIVIEGGDVIARVLGGMDWAVGKKARVLSMSLGFRGWWEDFVAITDLLRVRGILPVFAIGNEGPGTSRSPGNYSSVLSIGAHDRAGTVATFSSSQRFARRRDPIVPDLVAPGVAVVSARPGGGWQSMDGSSMATPHVAGLAALLFEAYPKRTIDQVESAILQSCSLPNGMDGHRAGRGVPDGLLALKILDGMP